MAQCAKKSVAKFARTAAVVAGTLLSIMASPLSGANAHIGACRSKHVHLT